MTARVLVQGVVKRLARRSRRSEVEGALLELDSQTWVFVPLEAGDAVPQLGKKDKAWTTLHHLRQALMEKNKRTTKVMRLSE